MSTSSNIALLNEDGTIDSIYCHDNGDPSANGVMLRENYQSIDKIRALIALGPLSHLAKEVGEKHPWDARWSTSSTQDKQYKHLVDEWEYVYEGQTKIAKRYSNYTKDLYQLYRTWSVAYVRDRGDDPTEDGIVYGARHWESEFEYNLALAAGQEIDAEWAYLYKGGYWWVGDVERIVTWRTLVPSIRAYAEMLYDWARPPIYAIADRIEAEGDAPPEL